MTTHHDSHIPSRMGKVAVVTRRTTVVSTESPYRPTYSTTPNMSGTKGSYFTSVTATATATASASASALGPGSLTSLPPTTSPPRASRPSSPPVTMLSQFGLPLPKTRPSTAAAVIRPRSSSARGKTTYAPFHADSPLPQRIIRPSSSAGLLLEKTAAATAAPTGHRIPVLPIGPTSKEEKRMGRIIPVAPGPVPPDERPDYGWNQPAGVIDNANARGDKSASWTQGLVEKGAKAAIEFEKKRWSSSTLARLKKWSRPLAMTHSKSTAMQVEAYLKQQRDYEAQRIADENQPPIKLPDTAVAGTTIAGHRYIAISIPLEADPFRPCLSPTLKQAQLSQAQQQQSKQEPRHQQQNQKPKPSQPLHRGPLSQHTISLSPPPSRPRVSSLSAITTQSNAVTAATAAAAATNQPVASMQSHLPQPDTQASTGRRNAIHTPSQSIGNESSVSRPATESGSDSGSNTYADSVTTATTSATSTPTISETGKRPGMVPRRSTSMLAQMRQQAMTKDITVTSTATSTTTTVQIPRRRTGTVSGGFTHTESIDQVMLDGQSISLQSAYPRPVRPVPDIPPIAAQKAKLAQMQATRVAAECDDSERDASHKRKNGSTSSTATSSKTRQQENAAKLAPLTVTSSISRRDTKTFSPTEGARSKASSEWRRSRQERVREKKMRDIERARSVRSQGSRNSVESPLESPASSQISPVTPSLSSVMVIVDVTPHQAASAPKSAPLLDGKSFANKRGGRSKRSSKAHKSASDDSDSDRPASRDSIAETVLSTASAPFAINDRQRASCRTTQAYDLRDMERRLRKLELNSGGNAVVKALEPALANLDRTLMTLYEGRVVEWMSEAAEKRRSRIVMETLESQSNPRTPDSSVYGERTFRLSRGPE
ncbi:hypothetical protein BROUX41_000889 [Berkeleyomyces rouxiae]